MTQVRAQVAEMYRCHAASVYRRALWILGNEADANEVLQDVFLSLLERPSRFSGASSVGTYLYSATTHACLNRARNQRNRARLLRERGAASALQPPLPPDVLVNIRHALERLPSPLAEVAVYYFIDDLSHEEIAGILGCSRRQVGHLVERINAWGRAQEVTCSSG